MHTKAMLWRGIGMLGCILFSVQAHAQVSDWVPMEIRDGHIYVGSAINGIEGMALIDTGAELNAINEQFLESADLKFKKGRKKKVSGVYETANLNTYKSVPVEVFGSNLEFNDLVGVNLGSPSTQMIIGAGFLKLFVFQFDYPNQRMRLISRDLLNLGELSNVRSRKDPWGTSPMVRVNLNDEKEVWLIMDTGFNGGVLLSWAEGSRWLDRYETDKGVTAGINSQATMNYFSLPVLEIGGYKIQNPSVSVPAAGAATRFAQPQRTSDTGPALRRKSVGLIGYDVLKHFVVTIDYVSGKVHLEAPQS